MPHCLLADLDPFAAIAEPSAGGIGPSGALVVCLGGILASAALFWLGQALLEKWRTRARPQSPLGLFEQLCRVHRLSRSERKLLAGFNGLRPVEQWPLVFIDPNIIDEACRAGDHFDGWSRLGQKLFGRDSSVS